MRERREWPEVEANELEQVSGGIVNAFDPAVKDPERFYTSGAYERSYKTLEQGVPFERFFGQSQGQDPRCFTDPVESPHMHPDDRFDQVFEREQRVLDRLPPDDGWDH